VTTESREINIATLRALIALHWEQEKGLRSLITQTTSRAARYEAILDLERLLHQIRIRMDDLANLEACCA
jgi:hypothetical protein